MSDRLDYLDLEDLLALARRLLGDPPPVRDIGLFASAVARPPASVFGQDAYPDIWAKAAALLQSIVSNHALVDGNKRLGWLSTAVFLNLNGAPVERARNADVYDLVIRVAGGEADVATIAAHLRQSSRSRSRPSDDGPEGQPATLWCPLLQRRGSRSA